jgi:hypothetical protein
MGKPGGNTNLAEEPLGLVPLGISAREQHLERHLSTVLQILGQIDRGHASASDLFFDTVAVRNSGSQALRHGRQSDSLVIRVLWKGTLRRSIHKRAGGG